MDLTLRSPNKRKSSYDYLYQTQEYFMSLDVQLFLFQTLSDNNWANHFYRVGSNIVLSFKISFFFFAVRDILLQQ